jgi:hypothetical protein
VSLLLALPTVVTVVLYHFLHCSKWYFMCGIEVSNSFNFTDFKRGTSDRVLLFGSKNIPVLVSKSGSTRVEFKFRLQEISFKFKLLEKNCENGSVI